jgi:hypothetical protein
MMPVGISQSLFLTYIVGILHILNGGVECFAECD